MQIVPVLVLAFPVQSPVLCTADEEACQNPHRTPLHFDSDSEDSDKD